MCELLGFSSKKEKQINNILKDFYKHSDEHPHGWGLVTMHDNKLTYNKESIKALKSKLLKQILKKPIITNLALAHIRLATTGNLVYENAHPFVQTDKSNRTWAFIHNGTMFDYSKITKYENLQKGQTDSERVLMYIVDIINSKTSQKQQKLTETERIKTIEDITLDLSDQNKLNYLLIDEKLMYVHTNMKKSLYYKESKDCFEIVTVPPNDEWIELPINTLYVIKDGKIIYKSKAHENEYVETQEQYDAIMEYIASLED